MKILQIHKYHHPLGGAETYYLELSKLLRKKGHEVAHFSMHHKKNLPSRWSKYFLENISFKNVYPKDSLRVFRRMIYSFEAKRKIASLLDEFHPDIAHVHNIYYHISPSILTELKRRGIPVVYTVHDYHLLTPNVVFYHNGSICEISKKRKFYKAVFHKCVADSYFASFAPAITLQIQHFLGLYEKNVDYFIAPSRFMREKLIEYGFDRKKIIYLPNFVDTDNFQKTPIKTKGGYVLFFGQLLEHKGVQVLIKAAAKTPDIEYKIAGNGKYKKTLIGLARKYRLKNVEFLGKLEGKKLENVISRARFCVLPSLWPENCPMTILEAFSLKKTVIASNIGGIPEIVEDGKNGLLFEAGDSNELTEKILFLWNNPKLSIKIGGAGRRTVADSFGPEKHYRRLTMIYKKSINSLGGKC